MTQGPFSGFRIVETAQGVAGPYCTKLLADLGADVIKVEPASGDSSRHEASDPEKSPLFLYCNTSKRSVIRSDEELEELLGSADVLITDNALTSARDGLLVTAITPYGLTGPRAQHPGGELTLGHAAGFSNLLPVRCRDTDRAPVMLGGHQVGYHGGLVAALATASFLLGTRDDRQSGLIDVSLQDVMLSLMAPAVTGSRYHETTWSRVPDRPPAMGRLQTRDGYVILNAFDDHHFALFRELLGNPDWLAGDEWLDMTYRTHHLLEVAPRVDEWALQQTRDDLYHRAAKLGIPVGPIHDASDVMDYAQYRARDYFTETTHPVAGKLELPGWPYRMGRSQPKVHRPAPQLGEHTAEVASESREPRPSSSKQTSLPLEGVRVLEFAWVWAGPYAGVLLSMLGAEVIKVEGPKRLDLMRRSVVWPQADERPHAVGTEGGMGFNTMNLNKRSVTIDLSQDEGRQLARKLAASCDVVYDNMRPDALIKLGLGYDELRQLRDDMIVASSSGRGHGGPESEYLGYAMVHQGVAGGAYISGYPDDHPTHSGGDVDLMNAITLAFSIVAALHHREQTGEGQFIDYSQCEGVTSILGEVLLDFQLNGTVRERSGNSHATSAPHNVYRCWGVDRWLALEVHTDEDFREFCEALGQTELASDPRFATSAGRKQNEADLDALVEGWTRERDRDWMVRKLSAVGLAVAPSRDGRDLYADSHLQERGSFVKVDHPDLGELELVGAPFRVEGFDLTPQHAPRLGEHNDQILKGLGLSEDEITGYRERGIIT